MKSLFKKIRMMFWFAFTGNIMDAVRYKLYILGWRNILPSSSIQKISIDKNDKKEMIDIRTIVKEDSNIIFYESIPTYYIRPLVAQKLLAIAREIEQEGLSLFINCLYRDLAEQTKRFNARLEAVKKENPNLSGEEIENIAKKFTARPSMLSPHVTGSTVDLCFF